MILKLTYKKATSVFVIILCIAIYSIFAYDLERTEYVKLFSLYGILFLLFLFFIKQHSNNLKLLTYLAFGFRALFLLAIPNLSQDFYRFLWDGRMLVEGFNPYLFTPNSFVESGNFPINQGQELIDGMGSLNASHFSNYPPINQLCFYIASLFAGNSILGSVVVLRLLIIIADFGTMYFGVKLLRNLNLPVSNIFWFILNPFIIIELTGNLHFEGVMIFFLVWSLYLLQKKQWLLASVLLGLSISVKLIPLMFLPVFFKWFYSRTQNSLNLSKLVGFYFVVGITTLLTFLPFYNADFMGNYTKTIGLYFQNFEFNASFYYLARAIGYQLTGYNQIAIIGKIIPVIVFLTILIISFFRKNQDFKTLLVSMLFCISVYYFTATTVHPWYIAMVLVLGIFSNFKFPIVWSFVIMLSYLAYMNSDNKENYLILIIEYLCIYGVFIWEVFIKSSKINKKTLSKVNF